MVLNRAWDGEGWDLVTSVTHGTGAASAGCGKDWVSGDLRKVGILSPQTGMWRAGLRCAGFTPARGAVRKRKTAWPFKDQLWPAEGQHVSVSRTKQNKTKQTTSNGQRASFPWGPLWDRLLFRPSAASGCVTLKEQLGKVSFKLHLLGVKDPRDPGV